jgi:RNA polymerase sigma-70 factor (ECF subfamily)
VAESDPGEEFRRLFERSNRDLLAQAFLLTDDRQEAQDLVQEVFLRAWRTWPRVAAMQAPDAWLRCVLHNLAVSRWRSLRRRRSVRVARTQDSPAPGVGHLDVVRALQSLPPGQREALIYVAVFDLTTVQAAREMNANEGSVRVWVSRGRTRLERLLGQDLEPITGSGERDGRI